jgi:hypothetical protein
MSFIATTFSVAALRHFVLQQFSVMTLSTGNNGYCRLGRYRFRKYRLHKILTEPNGLQKNSSFAPASVAIQSKRNSSPIVGGVLKIGGDRRMFIVCSCFNPLSGTYA